MFNRSVRTAVVAALVALVAAMAAVGASAKATAPKPDVKAEFQELRSWFRSTSAFPSWSFTYTDPTNGTAYPTTMIGNDPKTGKPSVVKTVIIPLKMKFVAGGQDTSVLNDLGYVGFRATPLAHTFNGARRVDDVLKSPIYRPAAYPADLGGDLAQYGDAFMRAQFDKIGSSYHVLMANVDVTDTQTVEVPAQYGLAYQRPVGAWRTANGMPTDTIAGVADFGWFVNYLLDEMVKLNIGPDVMPIFLTDNVMLYDGSYLGCCTIGFHGTPAAAATTAAASLPIAQQTLMFSAWTTPGTYSGFMTDYTGQRTAPRPTRGIADIHALSHEVAEALDDPFTNNYVKPWLTPTAPQYGCTDVLETGDPVVGVWFPLDGNSTGKKDGYNYYGQYHPEEEVFGQWYAHGGMEALGYHTWDGRLTFMGPRTTGLGGAYADFGTYSNGC